MRAGLKSGGGKESCCRDAQLWKLNQLSFQCPSCRKRTNAQLVEAGRMDAQPLKAGRGGNRYRCPAR